MGKRLIVCCDGTWNNPQQEDNGLPAPTNVVKIFNAIADQDGDTPQLKYYHPGVGGEGGAIRPIAGGAVGVGISRHICSAYQWLASNYETGDDIYLYGFSRGAFTARCVGGFLSYGLLNLKGLESAEAWMRVHRAYQEGYRSKTKIRDIDKNWQIFHQGEPTTVRFIGVWDTVGALGVPNDLALLNLLDDSAAWGFHDTSLGKHIQTGRHAMAIDEMRSSFCVTRWTNQDEHPDLVELWFPGVHSDVGGGYANCDLSAGALRWMIEESKKAKLVFHPHALTAITPNPLGLLHNSYKGLFTKLRSRPRNIPALDSSHAAFHDSAKSRQAQPPLEYPPYHSTRVLSQPGDSHTFNVYANQHWSYSEVFLEAGVKYVFEARGEWLDGNDACDWKGTQDNKLTIGDIVRGFSDLIGKSERLYQKVTDNKDADVAFTKRVQNINWFALVGAITNDNGETQQAVTNDGSPCAHQYVELCQHTRGNPLVLSNAGYLYCFPNDVWSLYSNNSGSLQVTVTRV